MTSIYHLPITHLHQIITIVQYNAKLYHRSLMNLQYQHTGFKVKHNLSDL